MVALFKNIFLASVYVVAIVLIPSQIIAQRSSIEAEGNEFRENFRGSILVISHEQILSSTKLGKGIIKKLKESEEILKAEAEEEAEAEFEISELFDDIGTAASEDEELIPKIDKSEEETSVTE